MSPSTRSTLVIGIRVTAAALCALLAVLGLFFCFLVTVADIGLRERRDGQLFTLLFTAASLAAAATGLLSRARMTWPAAITLTLLGLTVLALLRESTLVDGFTERAIFGVSLLFLAAVALGVPALARRLPPPRTGECPKCGYDRSATPDRPCPECGADESPP